ncbi:uncharacterized protein SCO4629-like [Littorina saxatilis]|uniref:uncharacterized protein SCO4629-like n=1 Tax=Littorina saxatilis TaxID=31220 RepID=UPI0038B651A8
MFRILLLCDVIMAMGSYDVRVARRAADLWLDGHGHWLVMSGKTGNLTKQLWTVPEADVFRDVAVGRGVPRERILLERESTNTGQNVKNTYTLLSLLGIQPRSILLLQKPYMERRAYATFLAQWPSSESNPDVIVTSPDVSLLDYPNDDIGPLNDVISVMLGDMQRIFLYGELGFQVKQEIPEAVVRAFEYLQFTERYSRHFQ